MPNSDQRILHILLADDDPDDSQLFTEAAGKLSFPFLFSLAEDGEKLLKFLSNNLVPDIIFLDLNMPGMSGKECLKAIRKDKKYDNIPVIIYSTSSAASDIEACYKFGANRYVVKPNYFTEILQILQKILAIDWDNNFFAPTRELFVLKYKH